MQTLLITGATGYLGSHLVHALLAAGHRVAILKRAVSNLSRLDDCMPQLAVFNIEDDLDLPFKSLGHIDAVIHTATCYGRSGEKASEIFAANTVFPLQLLETAAFFNTESFFNTDTILFKYLNAYSLSKHHFAEWGKGFADTGKINFVNIKLEHMYGAGDDSSKFSTHVISACLKNIDELQLTLGEQKRDFIHIDDVVSAYLCLLGNVGKVGKGFSEFAVGSGQAVSIRDFVNTVHRLTVSRTKLDFGAYPYREHELMQSEANLSGLLALGWQCRYDLETGLKQVINFERKHL
ncbi:NAD-dependent epimerase/dehydratase family protein [Methylobacter sp.]|uniref:NAD-dependent epimerase/dehydratase family protein n=1 Tax=Methylobacter sp. TaxID=2051955 RepID=UPI002FDE224D